VTGGVAACSRIRYHVKAITSRRGMRNSLAYVLNNWRHHREDRFDNTRDFAIRPVLDGIELHRLEPRVRGRLARDVSAVTRVGAENVAVARGLEDVWPQSTPTRFLARRMTSRALVHGGRHAVHSRKPTFQHQRRSVGVVDAKPSTGGLDDLDPPRHRPTTHRRGVVRHGATHGLLRRAIADAGVRRHGYPSAMRKLMFAAALACSAITGGCSKTETSEASPKADEKLPELTVDEVDKGIASKELQAADCNHDQLRKKAGVLARRDPDLERRRLSGEPAAGEQGGQARLSTAQTLVDTPAMLAPGAPRAGLHERVRDAGGDQGVGEGG